MMLLRIARVEPALRVKYVVSSKPFLRPENSQVDHVSAITHAEERHRCDRNSYHTHVACGDKELAGRS